MLHTCLLFLLKYPLHAVQLLPLLLLLSYPLGRRGHGRLCLWGVTRLSRLAVWLCWGSLLLLAADYARELLALPRWTDLSPWRLHTMAGSLLAAALAGVCLTALRRAERQFPHFPGCIADAQTCYDGRVIRLPMLLSLGALLCYFGMALLLEGMLMPPPQGMERAAMQQLVLSSTLHHAFAKMAPAGGAALFYLYCLRDAPLLANGNFDRVVRWCAVWAALGYFPSCIDIWSDMLLIPVQYFRYGLPMQELPLSVWGGIVPLTLAMLLWAVFLFRPEQARRLWLLCLPFVLLLLREVLVFCL